MKGSIFHKMQTSTCWIVCLVLLGVYLFAALRPGVWLRDAFLYRQADGSFSGKDAYAAYTLQLSGTESEAEAVFTLDGETRHYRIEAKNSAEVKLYQDGALIFAGSALGDPGDAILWREDDGDLADEVKVIVNGEYQKDDLWPSCGWLYNVAVGGRAGDPGQRGFPAADGGAGAAAVSGSPLPAAVLESPPRAGGIRRRADRLVLLDAAGGPHHRHRWHFCAGGPELCPPLRLTTARRGCCSAR